jgi:hypothetical protein
MSDNKTDRNGRDRATVSGDEPYEVRYFADKHGLTTQQAEELIEKHGNNRAQLDQAAQDLRQA